MIDDKYFEEALEEYVNLVAIRRANPPEFKDRNVKRELELRTNLIEFCEDKEGIRYERMERVFDRLI